MQHMASIKRVLRQLMKAEQGLNNTLKLREEWLYFFCKWDYICIIYNVPLYILLIFHRES